MKTLNERIEIYKWLLESLTDSKRRFEQGQGLQFKDNIFNLAGICFRLEHYRGINIVCLTELWESRPKYDAFGLQLSPIEIATSNYWYDVGDYDSRIALVKKALQIATNELDMLEEHEKSKRLRYMDTKDEVITDLRNKGFLIHF